MKIQRIKKEKQGEEPSGKAQRGKARDAKSSGVKASGTKAVKPQATPAPSTRKAKTDTKASSGKAAPKGKATPTRRDLLAVKPLRNPLLDWSEENGQVVLTIRRGKDWKTRLVLIFTQVPEERRVVLDPIGSHVWRMLDGANTFDTIARSLAKEFKLVPREAELSLQQFFKELGQRGYIVFAK